MAQHTVELTCIADTYIDEESPNTNYGTATALKPRDKRIPGGFVHKNAYAALKFDVSSFPERKRIITSKLKIYVTAKYLNGSSFSVAVGTNPNFIENTVTWNNKEGAWSTTQIVKSGSELTNNTYNVFDARSYGPISISPSMVYYSALIGIAGSGGYEGFEYYIEFSSRETANAPKLVITYEDVPPSKPTLLQPIGLYKDSFSSIRFEWQYNSSVGGEQKKFDLQWSEDQSSWTTVSQTTANNYYDMPANILPTGNIYWRVKTYNEYDEASEYSDISVFYSMGAPVVPAINELQTNTARPVVSWSAFGQQVYQLQVLSGEDITYDSGIVPGINIRQHKITAWLADGSYVVRLRIKNEYDLWSEWDSAAVTITTVKPTKPSVTAQPLAYGVELHISGISEYALIYRNDVCIGKTEDAMFTDYTVQSGKEYQYFVRSVSSGDTYNDSDIKLAHASFVHALIAPVSDLGNIFAFTRSLNAPPKRIYNRQPRGSYVEYAGRIHPIWTPAEHVSAAWTMGFFLKCWDDVEIFIALVDRKETVLYRDARGRKIYGILSNLTVNDERVGYTVNFAITEVDYNEEVEHNA